MFKKERQKIDQLDQQIIELLEERFDTVQKIAEKKQQANLTILDSKREQEVLEKVARYVENPKYTSYIQEIYTQFMEVSKKYQQAQIGEKE